MLKRLKAALIRSSLSDAETARIDRAMQSVNSAGFDDWGVSAENVKASLAATLWLYRTYFRVTTVGIDRVPGGRCLIIANHGGQVPIDAMLIAMSLMLEAEPPRLARGMVERWAPSLPFVSTFFARNGQVTGDQRNCRELLEKDQTVMVFPEGVGGSGKPIFKKYELQKFGTGFVRLALETRTPIIPVAVIGCEESYPSLSDLKPIAKFLGIPYIPVVPTGLLPLPTKVTLRFGEPIFFDADPDSSDQEVEAMVNQVKESIAAEIEAGLQARGNRIFTGEGK